MFNTYHSTTKHETKVCPVTKVVEKSISPDKVTETYQAVRNELIDNNIAAFKISNNFIEGYLEFSKDPVVGLIEYVFDFKCNGENIRIKDYVEHDMCLTHERHLDEILNHINEHITKELAHLMTGIVAKTLFIKQKQSELAKYNL